MATEVSPLVSDQATSRTNIISNMYATVKRRYQVYVYSRRAYVVLLYGILVFGMVHYNGTIIRSHLIRNKFNILGGWSYAIILPAFLLYPFIGVLGMFFSR